MMMRVLNLSFVVVLVTGLLAVPVDAGVPVLGLEEAVGIALESSYDARRMRLDMWRARKDMAAARGETLGRVSLSFDAPSFQERVTEFQLPNELPVYNTVGTILWGGRLEIQQPFVPTNATFSIRSDFRHSKESIFNDQAGSSNEEKRFLSQLTFSLRQPLFVPNDLKLGLERARLRLEQAERQFSRTQLDVIYGVTQAFYSYYSATRRLEIATAEVGRRDQSYELTQRKYQAGLIAEVEALQMEVALAESRNSLLQAEGTVARLADQFKAALGLQMADSVAVTAEIRARHFDVDVEKAVAHGLRHRTDVREREIGRRLSEISLRQVSSQRSVRGELTAFYDRTGVSDPFLSSDVGSRRLFDSSWSNLKRRPRNLGIGLRLTVPVWDWGTTDAQVASAEGALRRQEMGVAETREQVARQIRAVVTGLREAEGRLQVLAKSEAVAERSYDISLARFENGDITARELADAHESLTRAKVSYLAAYIQYELAAADLKRQTLYDFENDRSLVSGPD